MEKAEGGLLLWVPRKLRDRVCNVSSISIPADRPIPYPVGETADRRVLESDPSSDRRIVVVFKCVYAWLAILILFLSPPSIDVILERGKGCVRCAPTTKRGFSFPSNRNRRLRSNSSMNFLSLVTRYTEDASYDTFSTLFDALPQVFMNECWKYIEARN